MKWIFIIVIVFAGQLHAQNVIIKIIPQSIIVKDDTLFFKYKVFNKTNQNLLFYNLDQGVDFEVLDGKKKGANKKNIFPGLSLCIYDKTGRLPKKLKSHTIPFETPEFLLKQKSNSLEVNNVSDELNKSLLPKTYIRQTEPFENQLLLKNKKVKHTSDGSTIWFLYSGDSIEVDLKLSLWPIYLKKGQYKLSMFYVSNDFYDNEYYKRKNNDPELINTHQFKGILNSNVCKFNVQKDILL